MRLVIIIELQYTHSFYGFNGESFNTELVTAYQDCRLVVTIETMTVVGMIKRVYNLLKDKLNIVKLTFTSGANIA